MKKILKNTGTKDFNRIVRLEDFFEFGVHTPFNRLAYTEEDLKYKVKVIKKMQELGMKISLDKAGNICGTIALGKNPKKTLAIGSHTDSVYDGGQYDGVIRSNIWIASC